MATDYHSLLSRAVQALDSSTPDSRRAIYDRARSIAQGHIRSDDARWTPQRAQDEMSALENAIFEVEMEAGLAKSQTQSPPVDQGGEESSTFRSEISPIEKTSRGTGGITISGMVLLIAAGVAYFFWDDIQETINQGTTRGFTLCKTNGALRATKNGYGIGSVEAECRQKHEREIYASLTGRAGYENYTINIAFKGNVTNNTSGVIVTEFTVEVTNKIGRPDLSVRETQRVWLEPNGNTGFSIYVPTNTAPRPEDQASSGYEWKIIGVKGFRMS